MITEVSRTLGVAGGASAANPCCLNSTTHGTIHVHAPIRIWAVVQPRTREKQPRRAQPRGSRVLPPLVSRAITLVAQITGVEKLQIASGSPWENGYADTFPGRLRENPLHAAVSADVRADMGFGSLVAERTNIGGRTAASDISRPCRCHGVGTLPPHTHPSTQTHSATKHQPLSSIPRTASFARRTEIEVWAPRATEFNGEIKSLVHTSVEKQLRLLRSQSGTHPPQFLRVPHVETVYSGSFSRHACVRFGESIAPKSRHPKCMLSMHP